MSSIMPRPQTPVRSGEVVCVPSFAEWPALSHANRQSASSWDFSVAGVSVQSLRRVAREESASLAQDLTSRLGIEARRVEPDSAIIATGHQPEFYHPGVWIKDFLLERFATEMGASALDVVVDTDAFGEVAVTVPCMTPDVHRCHHALAVASADRYFASACVPSMQEIREFLADVSESVSSLQSPQLTAEWTRFAQHLVTSADEATNLAELMTIARRRHEGGTTGYLELPMTALAHGESFVHFVADLALNAQRFADDYNRELDAYRVATGTRSNAQPVPDLKVGEHGIELPLWALKGGVRRPVFAQRREGAVRLTDGDLTFAECPDAPSSLVACIAAGEVRYAPKALALTLFMRMFCCDLFIHGTGGGRYDRVTDGLIRRFYGVEPPAYVVASATLQLPLGVAATTPADVSEAKGRLNRLAHHPDEVLAEMGGGAGELQDAAGTLLAEKKELVSRIAQPDADKKAIGIRIREVNAELAGMLTPLREELERALARSEAALADNEILADRTYPYCFWSASELQNMAQSVR